MTLDVLICGGGIAGNALALQLARSGFRPTVVERSVTARPGGQAVDLRGPSREVADRMGLTPGIERRRLNEKGMIFLDDRGRERVRMPAELFGGNGGVAEIEITRGDLNQVLLDEISKVGGVDYRYGEWVTAVAQDSRGVLVRFASGTAQRFDLVVGADGVHSAMRRMVFGPEENFTEYLGGYMSFFTMPTPRSLRSEPGWFRMYSMPGAVTAGIRADVDAATSKAIVTVRMPSDPGLRRDAAAQRRLVRARLAAGGWEVPAILAALDDAEDLYFDELARVTMPKWSHGRVALLGDAAFCGSPLTGQGTAMALLGAYVLAGELAGNPSDIARAFERYEAVLRPFVDLARELPPGGLRAMTPSSRIGIRVGQAMTKLMTTRLLEPLMTRMLAKTDDYDLPEYSLTHQ
ncbi:FAD-dependent monooxygenase [Antrihabitans sp. YC2-6]|uniref:FAD-dependent monooxygenase n=1 Tax=Antrihabitans sp. YC2-6 TaxID=2799498 RepID=UPI0018F53B74|nr:FAD-dependent monooxygenase [Antrihabitans sp. YC2-6]MBJ8348172.1 FAD-dependent monooxygenase [Antrihabitans sp. YC2-6]